MIAFYKREGFLIRELVTDAGGEYGGGNERRVLESDYDATDDEGFVFSRTCKANGFVHTVTPARKPQLHGIAENWNRQVFRIANSLLYAARISHVLWASAVAHANYLKNRLPNERTLGKYTSYELFFKRRPRIGDLRVWGCDAYQLLPAGQVPGQQNRRRVIYVGHTPDRLGWRVFDPISWKFQVCHELLFDEESAKKRICALREFDSRRKLAKEGRLDELPLQADDFNTADIETTAALDSERRLYPIPLPPPDHAEGGGAVSNRAHEVPADSSASRAPARATGDGDAAVPGLKGLRAGKAAAPNGEDPDDSSDDEHLAAVELSDASFNSGDYFRSEALVEGEALPGPLIRPGRFPTVNATASADQAGNADSVGAAVQAGIVGSVGAGDAPGSISEDDAAYLFTRDDDAEQYGPLSETQLKRFR